MFKDNALSLEENPELRSNNEFISHEEIQDAKITEHQESNIVFDNEALNSHLAERQKRLDSRDKLILKQADRFETNVFQKGLLFANEEQKNDLDQFPLHIIRSGEYHRKKQKKKQGEAISPNTQMKPTRYLSVEEQLQKQGKKKKATQQSQEEPLNYEPLARNKNNISKKKLPPLQNNAQLANSTSKKKLPKLYFEDQKSEQNVAQITDKKQRKLNQDQIRGDKLYPRPLVRVQRVTNPKIFVSQSIQPGELLQTLLRRDISGMNYLYPQFHLFFSQGVKHLLSAKKIPFTVNNTYYMGDQGNYSLSSENYVGKGVSNFLGSIFNIYDDGVSRTQGDHREGKPVRQLLATVYYKSQLSIGFEPRKIQVYLRKKPFKYADLQGADYNNELNLKQLYQTYPSNKNKIYRAKNKQPIWSQQRKCYVSEFYGKVGVSSVKNMVMIGQEDNRQIMLFTKAQKNLYHLDIGYPLEPRVALGIVLSSFNFKWVCE